MNATLSTRIGITALVVVAASAILVSKHLSSDDAAQSAFTATDAVNRDVSSASAGGNPNDLAQHPAAESSRGAVSTASMEESRPLPRLLDLGADKCVPCKMMAPILDELRVDFTGEFNVAFIDVWKNPEAAKLHRVQLIPTQIFFDETGRELARHQGFFSREDILKKWRDLGYEFAGVESQPLHHADKDSAAAESAEVAVSEDGIASAEASLSELGWWIEFVYLHPTMRCHDCLRAEKIVGNAVREIFADELTLGYLCWRATNYEVPENHALAEQFSVSEGSELVIACVSNKGVMRWELVPDVLELGGDEFAAAACVRDAFLTFEQECHATHAGGPGDDPDDPAVGDI